VTLRGDRRSALEQEGLAPAEAMARELEIGRESLAQAVEGAARFSAGHGRHGDFGDV
jgi:enoyl-CoA hydratase